MERAGKSTEFLIENVRLLNEKELVEWKKANLKNVTRDISVFIPQGSDPEIIENVISRSDGVISAKIIDLYDKKDRISVTYRLTIFKDQDVATIHEKAGTLLKGIGCTIR